MTRSAIISWSSGKDSAWALHVARSSGEVDVVAAVTTVTHDFGRVSMHGVREEILERQMESIGLPLTKVVIPNPCDNETYERLFGEALTQFRRQGIEDAIFGDLYLEDIRSYRERQLERVGMNGMFPLWQRPTRTLAEEMVAAGVEAYVACADPRAVPRETAGRRFDAELLSSLPAGADPCGENGEFHTVVTAGPMMQQPIPTTVDAIVERDGFVFADIVPD